MSDENSSRRDWMRTAGIGLGGVAIGGAAGWFAHNPEPAPAPAPGSAPVIKKSLAKGPYRLQIFFHGMMVFHLPADGTGNIDVRIPHIAVTGDVPHAYYAGPPRYSALTALGSGRYYTFKGVKPSGVTSVLGNMTAGNLYLRSSTPCNVDSTIPRAGSTAQHCWLTLPMPDEYLGLNIVRQNDGTSPILTQALKGTAINCGCNQTRVFTIHAFRYNAAHYDASQTMMVDDQGRVIWTIGDLSLHIYAEPEMAMTPSGSHLAAFNQFFNPSLDLTFTNFNATVLDGSNADAEVLGPDLFSLVQLKGIAGGGDVTNCLSAFGS